MAGCLLVLLASLGVPTLAAENSARVDRAAVDGWRSDAPGARYHVTVRDLPAPYATDSAGRPPSVVSRPSLATLRVPPGFVVQRYATGFDNPRVLRVAPNGDIFLAETRPGRIRVLRPAPGGAAPDRIEVYATGLDGPFGMAFYPAGSDPQWLYIANNNSVVRIPYRNGDLRARSAAQTVVARLASTANGHSTRDLAFSNDGRRMFVSVGSQSNVAQGIVRKTAAEIRDFENLNGLGAIWGEEERRANVLAFDPAGRPEPKIFATGIRNCVGMLVHPQSGDLWCATNERDGLGDDLVPDYVTRVRAGAFYGWPWYYLGNFEDPRHRGARLDLAGKATVPDVLLQSHSAPLGIAAYNPPAGASAAFPAEYRGEIFAALHGSWNRSLRTGYKVVRVLLRDGVPTGEYEDFLTGFVIDDNRVWGRPVGIAVDRDGALLVSDDGSGTVWRIAPAR